MASIFNTISGGPQVYQDISNGKDIPSQFMGQNYNYAKYIANPTELGASSEGTLDALSSNIAALMDYTQMLAEGGGPASKNDGKPLGDRYFITTGASCTTPDGDSVKRSLYINNVPTGDIAFLGDMTGAHMTSMKGLVPGLLLDAQNLNPMGIMSAFGSTSAPKCRNIHAKTIGVNNEEGTGSGFVVDTEIKNLPPCVFVNGKNPVSGETCQTKESFVNANRKMFGEKNKKVANIKVSPLANLYTAAVSGLMVYIIYKLVYKD